MSKAADTKQLIIARAAPLFNQRGYSGTSISDVMEATGLKKGGIYNHFGSKDEIALEAFDFAYSIVRQRYATALREAARDPVRQLQAMIDVFAMTVSDPPVAGGCPLLNTAIDSDDTHGALRERVRAAMDEWRGTIYRIVERGKARGLFQPTVDGDDLATLIVASMEGAVMLSRLYDSDVDMERVRGFLLEHIRQHVIA